MAHQVMPPQHAHEQSPVARHLFEAAAGPLQHSGCPGAALADVSMAGAQPLRRMGSLQKTSGCEF